MTKTHPEAGTAMGCAEQVALVQCPINQGLGFMDVLVGVQVWKFPFGVMISLMMSICLERIHCPILALYGEKSIIPHILLRTFRPRVDMRSYLVYYDDNSHGGT